MIGAEMRRLLQDFDRVFVGDHPVDREPLAARITRILDEADADDLPEFGTEGDTRRVATQSDGYVQFNYRPHLFPGMADDLRLAHQLQFHLLPRELPEGAPVDVAAVLESFCHLSGDLFGWQKLRDGRFLIWIADVSGHGIGAGLCAAVLKVLIDRASERGEVARFVAEIDRDLHACKRPGYDALYATGFFMVFEDDGTATYCSAGHTPALLKRNDGTIETLESTSTPVGLLPGQRFESVELQLQRGDSLLLYTDGLIETTNKSGEMFGLERVHSMFDSPFGRPEEMTGRLYNELSARQNLPKLDDDVTFLVTTFGSRAP